MSVQKPQQRLSEWQDLTQQELEYHLSQWASPKRSTVAFENFLTNFKKVKGSILDLGSGAGAATAYFARKHPDSQFTAFDYSESLVEIGKKIKSDEGLENLEFMQGDWLKLPRTSKFDGVISLQTLSWLPEAAAPLKEIFKKISPQWIGITSLFYPGDISCKIEVNEHKKGKESFYNIYSRSG